MEIVGFANIKINATTGNGAKDVKKFFGKNCPVMEFAKDGGVLVVNPEGTELCMFDKCDVVSSFECSLVGNFIMPPKLNFIEQNLYMSRCMERKGGYSPILRDMVIVASIHKGTFTDNFLWQLQ